MSNFNHALFEHYCSFHIQFTHLDCFFKNKCCKQGESIPFLIGVKMQNFLSFQHFCLFFNIHFSRGNYVINLILVTSRITGEKLTNHFSLKMDYCWQKSHNKLALPPTKIFHLSCAKETKMGIFGLVLQHI